MLFSKDKFSEEGPKWEKLDAYDLVLTKNLKNISEKYYSDALGSVVNIFKVKGLEINSSNFLVEGSVGKIILKLVNENTFLQFKSEDQIYSYLDKLDTPLPRILGSANRNINFDYAHIALEYMDGKYFSGSNLELSIAATSINKLHTEIQKFELSYFSELPMLSNNSKTIFNDFIEIKDRWETLFDHETLNLLKKNINLIKIVINFCEENIKKLTIIDKSAFHIDLHPHNIIVQSKEAAIIDMDSIKISRWPIALGFTFYKLTRQALTEKSVTDNDLNFFYEQLTSSYISNKNKDDIELLFIGALSEVIRRLTIILEGNFDNKISQWNQVLSIQINAISEILFLSKKFSLSLIKEI